MTISEPSAYRNFSFGNFSPKLWVNLRLKNGGLHVVGKGSWKIEKLESFKLENAYQRLRVEVEKVNSS